MIKSDLMVMLLLLMMSAQTAQSPAPVFEHPPEAIEPSGPIEAVLLHPVFREPFTCGEHAAGERAIAGDSLGTDCQVLGDTRGKNRSFGRLYRTDGRTNEDWYSWGAEVLSPTDGVLIGLVHNTSVNVPGSKGKPPAGLMQIRRADGIVIMLGHLDNFSVAVGEKVRAGQPVAKVGNNGPSYAPHVHVGASRGSTPFQIRWDQRAMN